MSQSVGLIDFYEIIKPLGAQSLQLDFGPLHREATEDRQKALSSACCCPSWLAAAPVGRNRNNDNLSYIGEVQQLVQGHQSGSEHYKTKQITGQGTPGFPTRCNLSLPLHSTFYGAPMESILTSCISVWSGIWPSQRPQSSSMGHVDSRVHHQHLSLSCQECHLHEVSTRPPMHIRSVPSARHRCPIWGTVLQHSNGNLHVQLFPFSRRCCPYLPISMTFVMVQEFNTHFMRIM